MTSDLIDIMQQPKPTRAAPPAGAMVAIVGDADNRSTIYITELSAQEGLRKLVESGGAGITPLDFPKGRRVSDLIFKLRRKYGIDIRTQEETHTSVIEGQEVSGHHARYRLAVRVQIVRDDAREVAA